MYFNNEVFFPAPLPAQKVFCIPPLDTWQTAVLSFCQSFLGQAYPRHCRQGSLNAAVRRSHWFYNLTVLNTASVTHFTLVSGYLC